MILENEGIGMSEIDVEELKRLAAERTKADKEIDRLRSKVKRLAGLLRIFMEVVGEPPKASCRCFLSAPCSDCTDNASMRELFELANASLEDLDRFLPVANEGGAQ